PSVRRGGRVCSHVSPPTQISTLSLHDALPISLARVRGGGGRGLRRRRRHHGESGQRRHAALELQRASPGHRRRPELQAQRLGQRDRKSTRLNSSHVKISYAVFRSIKKTNSNNT